jgi:nitroreductase
VTQATDFFDVIYSTRAIRRFKPDPVPQDLMRRVIEAATQAPSGGNTQPWRFLVVRDPAIKAKLGDAYLRGFSDYSGKSADQLRAETTESPNADLAVHFGEAPVVVVVCAEFRPSPGDSTGMVGQPSSLYPAVQNMLLTARALGLGGVLTTNHRFYEKDIKAALGIPDNVVIFTMVPMGYPRGRHGPKTRQPVEEVSFSDRWDGAPVF